MIVKIIEKSKNFTDAKIAHIKAKYDNMQIDKIPGYLCGIVQNPYETYLVCTIDIDNSPRDLYIDVLKFIKKIKGNDE